ncbi:hypothetical protein [Enterococcus gallinarum]|uniref:hypothetical protein n=1 Tax=Enterococcus gallinarum TaxID=1353 RepID=UPI001BD87AB0|nr:hypothetical protein [Enterococcus gallinarum]
MDIISVQRILIIGLGCTLFLLLFAFLLKITNGLFWARFPHKFLSDRNDPKFETERKAGKMFSYFVFKYIPPIFIGFVITLLLTYLVK